MPGRKLKVGLIVDEFFGGANTAYGGYGFLARNIICKYIPNNEIEIDVLLGKGKSNFFATHVIVDNTSVYRLPRRKYFAKKWLDNKNYDIYLSVELTSSYIVELEINSKKKLILWIQDPRPQYEWDEINTVKLFTETSYYNQKIYDLVHQYYFNKKVEFISQAKFLNKKAIDLYDLNKDTSITYIPNPIEIDYDFSVDKYVKKDMIIFLGRLESVKRGWLFCEIAKKTPQYDFYVLGQCFREHTKNSEIFSKYMDLPNLHFVGHVEGELKDNFLKNAKILINTSIHEGLPISFLEALSYGTVLISNRNPDNLTSEFGIHVGDVLGDGFDQIDLFVDAVNYLMKNEIERTQIAIKARKYIEEVHNIAKFTQDLRSILIENL